MKRWALPLVVCCFAGIARVSAQEVIFRAGPIAPVDLYVVGLDPASGDVVTLAYPFTVASASYHLDSIVLTLRVYAGQYAPAGVRVILYSDDGGKPGSVLETWDGIQVPFQFFTETAASSIHPLLAKGDQYWFGVTTTNPAETAAWATGAPGNTEVRGCRSVNGEPFSAANCSTSFSGAFQLWGTRACTLDLALSYGAGTLTINFNLGTDVPRTWNLWVTFGQNSMAQGWSVALPAIDPAVSFPLSFPLTASGRIGVLSSLTTSQGILCSDFKTVNTSP